MCIYSTLAYTMPKLDHLLVCLPQQTGQHGSHDTHCNFNLNLGSLCHCTILWHCPMLPLTAEACSVGFGGTHIHLITCCNEGVLDNDVLTCGLFWRDIMFSETFKQQAIAYVFPSINNTCYHHRTPQQLPAQQQPSRYLIWFRWRCSAASSISLLISLQT